MSTTVKTEEVAVEKSLVVTDEHKAVLQEIISYQESGARVGERVLRLPEIFASVLFGQATQVDFARASKLGENVVGRLFLTATILYYTKVTSPRVALDLSTYVQKETTGKEASKFSDVTERFKNKVGGFDAFGQPKPSRWVEGDLEVAARISKNELEVARDLKKAKKLAEGKAPAPRKVPTLAQRLVKQAQEVQAITNAITVQGVVTDDVREAYKELSEAIEDLAEIISAG